MAKRVEELPDDKVRLTVDVPSADVHHAVEHAASDLASSVKIPGFRKGKVPMPVLRSHIGKERLLSEAIESHISGWFWNAAARERIRPVRFRGHGLAFHGDGVGAPEARSRRLDKGAGAVRRA